MIASGAKPVIVSKDFAYFDGSVSLKTAMENVAKRLPGLSHVALERLAVLLLMRLLAQRLIYLDTAREI